MSQSTTERIRRILLLGAAHHDDPAGLEALSDCGEVSIAAEIGDALDALKARDFDLVVGAPSDLLSLALTIGQSKTEALLERIGHGICVIHRAGRVVWTNSALRAQSPEVLEAVRRTCVGFFEQNTPDMDCGDRAMTLRDSVRVGRDLYFDVTASPLRSPDGEIEQVVALVYDVSAARRLQERMNAIDEAGRALVDLDAEALCKLDVGERLALLEQKIIGFSHDLLHFDHFVVRVLDKKTNRLDTVFASGLSEEAKDLEILAEAEGQGISGFVAATGQSYICRDARSDSRYLPGLEKAGSTLTVPLRLHQQVIGVLNVESEKIGAFGEEDRRFAEIFARYIATALHVLQLLAVERRATHGEIAANVDAEMATPLNDIITDVKQLIEERVGDETLRARLRAILGDVDRVRDAIHAVTEPDAVTGLVDRTPRDPLLVGKRVLIVDDEDIIRETVCDVLTRAGACTIAARDGTDAINRIQNEHFDLILSDIKMPNRSGYDVFAAARRVRGDLPVVLITGFGYDPSHAIVRASKEGLNGVLFKPFKVEDLLAQVRRALLPAQS